MEPHTARVVAICRADPFAVETSGTMHPPTWGPIPTTCLPLAPAFHHNCPSSPVTGAGTAAVSDPVLRSSCVSSVCFPILPCTLQSPKVGKNLNHTRRGYCNGVCVCLCVCARTCTLVPLGDAFLHEFKTPGKTHTSLRRVNLAVDTS